ncbi:unnamed protein product, partial [Prunus brigantina]
GVLFLFPSRSSSFPTKLATTPLLVLSMELYLIHRFLNNPLLYFSLFSPYPLFSVSLIPLFSYHIVTLRINLTLKSSQIGFEIDGAQKGRSMRN